MRSRRVYIVLMSIALALVVLAWNVVRLFSVTAAIIMSVVAALLLPIAVIIANAGREG
jgi:Protein of unknown function (DUF3099)